jgi:transcriptional regulator with XRE-family HTH domain
MGNRIKELRERRKLSQESLAKRAGTSTPQIQRLESGKRRLNADWIKRLSNALNIEEYELFAEPFTKLRILSEVCAGRWTEPEMMDSEIGELENVAPPSKYADTAYGLRVAGESMNLVYKEGTYLICVPWQYAPPVNNGVHVIIRRAHDGGFVEVTVKEYRYNNGKHELWPRSTDERWQEPIIVPDMVASQRMDSVEVTFEAVVISSYRDEVKAY